MRDIDAHQLVPSTAGDHNMIFKAPAGMEKECENLPAIFDHNTGVITSLWKTKSIWTRFKFLFNGTLSLMITGNQPPVNLYVGDFVREHYDPLYIQDLKNSRNNDQESA